MKRLFLIAILASSSWRQASLQTPPATTPKTPAPAIIIDRTGGFAGVDDEVSIFPDGKVLDNSGKVRRIPPADLSRFIHSVEKVGIAAKHETQGKTSSHCSDCFMYAVKIQQGDTFRRFVIEEPILHASGKDAADIRVVRDFLAAVFGISSPK